MNQRVEKLRKKLLINEYPICIEKIRLLTQSFKQTEGEPAIVRRAKGFAHYLDNKKIFIEDDELIVGNVASKPMGFEASAPTWPADDMEDLRKGGLRLSNEEEAELRSYDSFWKGRGFFIFDRIGQFLDDERMWPFMQTGMILPPFKNKFEGMGYGQAGYGWGLGLGLCLIIIDYAKVINEGLNKIIKDAEEELSKLRYFSTDDLLKADFLKSVIIVHKAVVRISKQYAELASDMASREKDANRKKELEKIAEICNKVPGNPATSFAEAIQSFWFTWIIVGEGAMPGGRFDQYMYPFYKKDRDAGIITDEEVIELLECLRVKVMQLNYIMGGKTQREKWAGIARWNNWTISGVTADGKDATNELSYLLLEAARDCQTPHYTITVRVHDKTPEKLMIKALEVIKTGIGMPAFVSDYSYIEYLTGQGVSLEDARNYALAGCLDVNIPGKSRINAISMFVVPLVFEVTMNNGIDPKTGRQLGPKTGEFETFKTFDELMKAFKTQLAHFLSLAAEYQNILLRAQTEVTPEAFMSSLMHDAIKIGKDVLSRTMPFENGSSLNAVGMINVADSMAAIKKLIFEDKKISSKQLKIAIAENWQGEKNQEIRQMCLAVPKYGNGDSYVDSIAGDLYKFWVDTITTFHTAWGGTMKPSGISITSHGPGGALTGATPDGRYAGENLADGSMSAAQGRDTHGPTALMRSAMAINQLPFQSTLLNMKFHPSALKTEEDLKKLSSLIKTYFSAGGKHVQFNVVSRDTLYDAQKKPENHRDLIVRVAGYSAYFVQLTNAIQNDIISRTEHELAK